MLKKTFFIFLLGILQTFKSNSAPLQGNIVIVINNDTSENIKIKNIYYQRENKYLNFNNNQKNNENILFDKQENQNQKQSNNNIEITLLKDTPRDKNNDISKSNSVGKVEKDKKNKLNLGVDIQKRPKSLDKKNDQEKNKKNIKKSLSNDSLKKVCNKINIMNLFKKQKKDKNLKEENKNNIVIEISNKDYDDSFIKKIDTYVKKEPKLMDTETIECKDIKIESSKSYNFNILDYTLKSDFIESEKPYKFMLDVDGKKIITFDAYIIVDFEDNKYFGEIENIKTIGEGITATIKKGEKRWDWVIEIQFQ
jgi:hypothetical protein